MSKHRNKNSINRKKSYKKSNLKNLTLSLFKHKKIFTTTNNAKLLKKKTDKIINLYKTRTLISKRFISSFLGNKKYLKLVELIVNKNNNLNSGYTKVLKYGNRKGDNASISFIGFINF